VAHPAELPAERAPTILAHEPRRQAPRRDRAREHVRRRRGRRDANAVPRSLAEPNLPNLPRPPASRDYSPRALCSPNPATVRCTKLRRGRRAPIVTSVPITGERRYFDPLLRVRRRSRSPPGSSRRTAVRLQCERLSPPPEGKSRPSSLATRRAANRRSVVGPVPLFVTSACSSHRAPKTTCRGGNCRASHANPIKPRPPPGTASTVRRAASSPAGEACDRRRPTIAEHAGIGGPAPGREARGVGDRHLFPTVPERRAVIAGANTVCDAAHRHWTRPIGIGPAAERPSRS